MAKSKKINAEDIAKKTVKDGIKEFYATNGEMKVIDNVNADGTVQDERFTKDTLVIVTPNGVEVQVKLITPRAVDGTPGTYGLVG